MRRFLYPAALLLGLAGVAAYAQQTSIVQAVVTSIAGNTGAFTLTNGLDNSTNAIQLTAARRTLPTTQTFTTGTDQTYNVPANTLWIEVYLQGGGGAGAGSGTTGGGAGTAGNPSCFKASGTACSTPLYQAGGGGAGVFNPGSGGAGGTITGSGTCTNPQAGFAGDSVIAVATADSKGGTGAGRGGGAGTGTTGTTAVANSGGGGGGAGSATAATFGGGGGGSGGLCYVIINSPAASYVYTIGGTASGGSAGTSGNAGGGGANGYLLVIEHYGS